MTKPKYVKCISCGYPKKWQHNNELVPCRSCYLASIRNTIITSRMCEGCGQMTNNNQCCSKKCFGIVQKRERLFNILDLHYSFIGESVNVLC